MRQGRRTVAIVLLLVVSACGTSNTDTDAIVARAERITVDLAAMIDDSPGIASTVRYACSADPALQVAQTNLSAPAAQAPRDAAVEMTSFLETEAFETTLVNGGAGTQDVLLRASDFELTIDVHFSADATTITVTTDCMRSG